MEKVAILSGLDPNAGFYHADFYGKPTLVFDVIELFRAEVDRIAVSFFTKRRIKDAWFENNNPEFPNGVFLSKEGRQNLIEEFMNKVAKDFEKEAWAFCRKMITVLLEEG